METEARPLEQPFVQRVRRFVEWLVEWTPLLPSNPHETHNQPLPASYDAPVHLRLTSPTSRLLHPVYALTAGLVCHKVLERILASVPSLACGPWSRKADFQEAIRRAFLYSSRLAPGLAPLFLSAIEAASIIPDTQLVLTGIGSFLEDLRSFPLDSIQFGTLGTVFESLTPRVERHELGQFYTPAFIAEVLVRWAVRCSTDRVLDPSCGAGAILTRACTRLRSLEERGSARWLETALDEKSDNRLIGIDVDAAAIRLAEANLAVQTLGLRSGVAHFVVENFFNIAPQETTTTDDSKTCRREAITPDISISLVDAVVSNPPYTRWSELPRAARRQIQSQLGNVLRRYHLSPRRGWGGEAGLHIYFVLWAHQFLRAGGRMALVLSDSWLQSDFGAAFGRFLLDHFRVRAVVDLGSRVFSAPIVGACLLLLEREDDAATRATSITRFIHLKGVKGKSHCDVQDMLRALDGNEPDSSMFAVREIAQQRIPVDVKWIRNFFDIEASLESLRRSSLMTRLDRLGDVAYGNVSYLVLTSKGTVRGVPNVGGERFFYLSDHDAQTWHLSPPWVHPLLPSGRYAQFFRFAETDWEALRTRGVRCWLFTAHGGGRLPTAISEYIRHGESSVQLRRMKRSDEAAKTVSESFASAVRRRHPEHFDGWFDLGALQPAPIFAIRGTQHRPRFVLTDFPVGLDDRLIALLPKAALSKEHLKALVAGLNSTFTQFQIEATCRSTGGGMVELDLRHTAGLLVPDITHLPSETVTALAKLFHKLEQRARQLGGADGKAQIQRLASLFDQIDSELAAATGMSQAELRRIQTLARTLAQRRLSRVTTPLTV